MTGGRIVLVVDDDEAIRGIVRDALEFEGYRVVVAEDGAVGLAELEQLGPCIVLLDMRMPVLDGWGFARGARERGLEAHIVVMTAAENAQRWCDEIGGEECLAKPFDLDILLATVERACGRAA